MSASHPISVCAVVLASILLPKPALAGGLHELCCVFCFQQPRPWVKLLWMCVWSVVCCGFLVLTAQHGKTVFKVRKGQEWKRADVLARGPDVPILLVGSSLNHLWLGLCHKQSQPTALRGTRCWEGFLLNHSVDCSLTLELTGKICEGTWPSVVAAAGASMSS